MARKLICRRLERKDGAQLSELQKEVFGVNRDSAYWDWKYFQNPAGEHAMYVAIDPSSDRIVGEHGTIPIKMNIGAKECLSSLGVDIVELPEYQKGGPFFRLHKLATEEGSSRTAFTYAFTIKKTYRIFTRLLRFKGVCPVCNFVKILNPTPFLQRKIKIRFFARLCGSIGRQIIKLRSNRKSPIPDELTARNVEQFDHSFDRFWQQKVKKYDIMTIRDADYLNWRYINNPEATYKTIALKQTEEGSIEGFIVLRTVQKEIKRGYIVDILVANNGDELVQLLLSKAVDYFYTEGVDSISCWMLEHTPIAATLKKTGFKLRETPHDLIIRSYTADVPKEYLIDKFKWYFTIGDSDFV